MLAIKNAVLLVIDVQEKLMRVMCRREELIDNMQKLIRGVQVLGVPSIITEQYPQGLGTTIVEIAQCIPGIQPLPKVSFSCLGETKIGSKIQDTGRRQVIVCGIESHVCVYQTVRDLKAINYEVNVVADAVSSRTQENREIGLNLMLRAGAVISSVETVLFELLEVAQGEKFKEISRIVK